MDQIKENGFHPIQVFVPFPFRQRVAEQFQIIAKVPLGRIFLL